ncbi:Dabb family protein [Nakamurella flavida]|uniref:Dabb family protein n=1 Tax=Nakamurella flavida TaxID=363630 RepID=A0A939C6I4_9ACTN|nr:Dabb family protein [Nakamurella flavida]MBM9478109.1 Dabb family protein [Nakamurella flavida]MDP9778670.1 hypothetical protein [Nakamurella flavida]
MIRHIVVFSVAGEDAAARSATAATVKDGLEALPAQIPQIRRLEVGLDLGTVERNADLVLLTEFDTPEDLAAYQVHPAHQAFVAQVGPLLAGTAEVDHLI